MLMKINNEQINTCQLRKLEVKAAGISLAGGSTSIVVLNKMLDVVVGSCYTRLHDDCAIYLNKSMPIEMRNHCCNYLFSRYSSTTIMYNGIGLTTPRGRYARFSDFTDEFIINLSLNIVVQVVMFSVTCLP